MQEGAEQPEIPSKIDFQDPAQAEAWVQRTVEELPCRPQFFNAMIAALNRHFRDAFDVAELGSGPGHLARAIVSYCPVKSYVALDFSAAMHALAREHLGQYAARVTFVGADFRQSDWVKVIGKPQALLTMQSAHEVRHKSRLPRLLSQMHAALPRGGMLLFCDHYAQAGTGTEDELYAGREEQLRMIRGAGFKRVICLRDEGGLALYSGVSS